MSSQGSRPVLSKSEAAQTAKPSRIEYVRLGDMMVDPAYQRPLNERKLNKMLADPDLDAIGVLCASCRVTKNGVVYALLDGQHRWKFLLALDFSPEDVVQTEVFDNLSRAEEAAIYRLRNTAEKVGRLDLYRARLVEHEPVAMGMSDIVARFGWKIEQGGFDGHCTCVDTVEQVYLYDQGKTLNMVFATIAGSYDRQKGVAHRAMVSGLGKLYYRHPGISVEEMITRLSKVKASSVVADSRSVSTMFRTKLGDAAAEVLTGIYNSNRKEVNKLPAWRS